MPHLSGLNLDLNVDFDLDEYCSRANSVNRWTKLRETPPSWEDHHGLWQSLELVDEAIAAGLKKHESYYQALRGYEGMYFQRLRLQVEKVVIRRRVLLSSQPATEALNPSSGRWLGFILERSLDDGASVPASDGLIDSENVPAHDFWVDLLDVQARNFELLLVSWIPNRFRKPIECAVNSNPEQCLVWLDITP